MDKQRQEGLIKPHVWHLKCVTMTKQNYRHSFEVNSHRSGVIVACGPKYNHGGSLMMATV